MALVANLGLVAGILSYQVFPVLTSKDAIADAVHAVDARLSSLGRCA